jgi:hypothetical protein
MISHEGQRIIHQTIGLLHEVKGPAGKVRLTVSFERNREPVYGTRGVISPQPVSSEIPDTCEGPEGFQTTGSLSVGAWITFSGLVPQAGYLHLFNLGTSGTCVKLSPSAEHPDNQVSPDEVFELPSDQLYDCQSHFEVQGPTTEESGEPERLLAILTLDDIDLRCHDLHPNLVDRDLLTPLDRGRGFAGPVGATTSRLLQLERSRWEYGLVELDVVQVP